MKYLLIMLLLAGCTTPESKAVSAERGELRHKLFVECMELSAKIKRVSDDDVHKVVDSCTESAFYQANQMLP